MGFGTPGWVQTNVNGFGRRHNYNVLSLTSFKGQLSAGSNNNQGAQLWRMGSAWTQAMSGGFNGAANRGIDHLLEFKGDLYAGTWNWDLAIDDTHGGEIWRSGDGST